VRRRHSLMAAVKTSSSFSVGMVKRDLKAV
jgi:hypothetical protein